MVAAPELAAVAARAHQFLTFATAPNLQAAVAFGLNEGDAWIEPMRQRFARARDRMTEGLRSAGFHVLDSASTYFLNVDLPRSGIPLDDESFATRAVEEAGVAVVPLSAFAESAPRVELIPATVAPPIGPYSDSGRPTLRDYIALTKPRVISLLLFTTLTGCLLCGGKSPHRMKHLCKRRNGIFRGVSAHKRPDFYRNA